MDNVGYVIVLAALLIQIPGMLQGYRVSIAAGFWSIGILSAMLILDFLRWKRNRQSRQEVNRDPE